MKIANHQSLADYVLSMVEELNLIKRGDMEPHKCNVRQQWMHIHKKRKQAALTDDRPFQTEAKFEHSLKHSQGIEHRFWEEIETRGAGGREFCTQQEGLRQGWKAEWQGKMWFISMSLTARMANCT